MAHCSSPILKKVSSLFIVLLFLPFASGCSQGTSEDVQWLINVLALTEGDVVADIGAGDGDQSIAMARHLGAEGKVYSTELGENAISDLRNHIEQSGLSNITVIEGAAGHTNLPAACCDAIYMRRVYHHIGDPPAMNASLLQSLKPGGRLAIIDFEPREGEGEPGGRASGSQHGVTLDTVVKEITAAGFTLVERNQRGRNIYAVFEI